MTVTIRTAASSDAETIAGFNAAMALETESLQLDRARLLEGVRAVLADSSKGFYVIADLSGVVVGQMMVTFEWSDWRNGVFWWIQSVYVRQESRRQGVFQALYHHVEAQARAAGGVCGLRLYVERHNKRAQSTYQNLGMKETDYLVYEVDFVLRR